MNSKLSRSAFEREHRRLSMQCEKNTIGPLAIIIITISLCIVLLMAYVMAPATDAEPLEPLEPPTLMALSIQVPLDSPTERLVTSARVKSVYDGDTVVLELTKEIRVRMLDCWAAEVRTTDKEEKERGFAAKAYLQSMISSGDKVLVDIPMSNKLQDSLTFGRVLAYIYKDVDGDGEQDNLSAKMIEGGHATKTKTKPEPGIE